MRAAAARAYATPAAESGESPPSTPSQSFCV
jgi:hypothetical protein